MKKGEKLNNGASYKKGTNRYVFKGKKFRKRIK